MNRKTFLALFERDIRVLIREFDEFFLRVAVQPLFLAFIFGYVLPRTGAIKPAFANLIFPGILGISTMTAGVQGTAIPLAWDFGTTKEIEDRLLAPIDVVWVMIEKILFGAFQALIAASVVFPFALFLMASNLNLQVANYFALVGVIVLSGLTSAALGMVLGTIFEPMKFALMFATIVIPMVFLGATYYPWASLKTLPWLKWSILINPLLYVSEGYRALLTPFVPHMPITYALLGLFISVLILTAVAVRGFNKRAFS